MVLSFTLRLAAAVQWFVPHYIDEPSTGSIGLTARQPRGLALQVLIQQNLTNAHQSATPFVNTSHSC